MENARIKSSNVPVIPLRLNLDDDKIKSFREIEETYRLLIQNFPTPIYIVKKGVFHFVNPVFLKMTGYSETEISGQREAWTWSILTTGSLYAAMPSAL